VAPALAGLRANEARYFKNKYDHDFAVEPAQDAQATIDWVHRILSEERDLVIASRPLEATAFEVDGLRMAYVFYESGLSINVMYSVADGGKRAVGFKLSEGMEVPEELASRFQVRDPEVQVGRHDPGHVLRHKGRALRRAAAAGRLASARRDGRGQRARQPCHGRPWTRAAYDDERQRQAPVPSASGAFVEAPPCVAGSGS
jgi:hypothetical protein